MPADLPPGVHVEEILPQAKPIEAVATSVAAFVGTARKGPAGESVLVHSWGDYVRNFGPIRSNQDWMGLAVSAFFLNGGQDAYIARLVSADPPAVASSTSVTGQNTGADAVLTITASSVGQWGDDVSVRIRKDSATSLTFALDAGHLEDAKFIADESFTGLVMNARSGDFALTRVNGVSRFINLSLAPKADPKVAGNAYQQASLKGAAVSAAANFFSDGLRGEPVMNLNFDGLGVKQIQIRVADLHLKADNAADGAAVASAITAAVAELGPQDSYAHFTCAYKPDRRFLLTSGINASDSSLAINDGDKSAGDLAHFLRLDSAAFPETTAGAANVVPVALGVSGQGVRLTGGAADNPTRTEFKNFFDELKKLPDVSILVLPGQSMPKNESGNPIIAEALAHAEDTRSRMVIIDPAPDAVLDQATAVNQIGLPTSSYAALYYPWVMVANPLYTPKTASTEPATLAVAPSGFAAGIWSKIDAQHGVWKAPAGAETALLGVSGLAQDVSDGEQGQLNSLGVNCIRKLPGSGPVIWSARTLATKSDPEWRYIPVRRMAIMIERSIQNGIQWAVFEPNTDKLWASLRANIGAFMNGLFRSGALQGEKTSDAYFVRCGLGDTMTQDDIDSGQVIVIVGFAPLKPAEFVIIRIQQNVAQQ